MKSELDVELDDRGPGMQHCTTQVGPSDHATPYVSEACSRRMIGMKVISFPRARYVWPTYGMAAKNDITPDRN